MNPDMQRRFGGIDRLYGSGAVKKLSKAHVGVIGVGGVGSWAVEALARSGVGSITLIDMDHVAESNINRQLPALDSTLGQAKVQVLQSRISDINPLCRVDAIEDFLDADNCSRLLHAGLDHVIDCIDSFRLKALVIHHCRSKRIPLITTGGAGGRQDPGQIVRADLARSEHDPLLAKTRSLLRREYGFPRNPRRKFGIACVWSQEQPQYLWEDGSMRQQRPPSCNSTDLNCGGMGSCMPVTATFATIATAQVIARLLQKG